MSGDRMMELLTEQTERPLTRDERAELERMLAAAPEWSADDFELAAAAAAIAMLGPVEPMPEALKGRVMASLAETLVDTAETTAIPAQSRATGVVRPDAVKRPGAAERPAVVEGPGRVGTPTAAERPRPERTARPAQRSVRARVIQYGGWALAAAAIILLVLVIGRGRFGSPDNLQDVRAQLLAGTTSVRAPWSNTEDPLSKGASGDVVFDASRQQGVLRFVGLPPNDPTKAQYQLWIFDQTRSDAQPVDGGVFDVGSDGEVLVAIEPKLRVFQPVMFAVTLERPGGVVVSSRERLVVLAKVSG